MSSLSIPQVILKVIGLVCKERGIKLAVTESVKGACVAGGAALLGGLLFGRAGIYVGSAIGSLCGAGMAKSYKPVHEVIQNDLTPHQRQNLVSMCMNLLSGFVYCNVGQLVAILATHTDIFTQLLGLLQQFFLKAIGSQMTLC